MKRKLPSMLVLLFLIFFTLQTYATSNTYKLDELGLEISIPSTYDVITRDTPVSSPIFKELGISGKELIEQFKTTFIYLNAIPKGVTSEEIVVTMAPNDINNFSVLSATSLKMFASSWISTYEELGFNISKYDVYEHSQAKFVRFYFEDTVNSVNGLQYYTIYNGKAINFTIRSYSGGITSTQEQAIKNIVDTIKFDTPPVEIPSGVETEAFIYTDTKTNTKFTVPANWYEKELFKERDAIDVKFVSSKEEDMTIMYGSIDFWAMLTEEEKVGFSRSDMNTSALSSEDIEYLASMLGVDKGEISKVKYNGVEYYQFTIKGSTELYGFDFTLEMVHTVRLDNGWAYWFQFGGTSDSIYFADFEALLNTVQYASNSSVGLLNSDTNDRLSDDNNSSDYLSRVVIVALLIGIILVLLWYNRKDDEQDEENSNSDSVLNETYDSRETIKCSNCGSELTRDSLFCHICGAKNETNTNDTGDEKQ